MTAIRRTSVLGLAVLPATILFTVLTILGCGLHGGGDGYWSASFGGSCGEIHQLPDGGYVLARRHGHFTDSVGLLRTDGEFRLMWSVDCTSGAWMNLYSVLTTSDGGYLLTGDEGDGASRRVVLVKIDTDGSMVWKLRTGLWNEGGHSSCRTADGGYMTTGGQDHRVTLARVSANGAVEWQASGEPGYSNWITQTPDHSYLVACHYPTRLYKFDSAGTPVWSRSLQSVMNEISYAYFAPNGECVMASNDFPSIMMLDTAGNVKWQRTFDRVFHAFSSVQPTSDGGFILAGTRHGAGSNDIALVKTDSLGWEEWSRTLGEDAVLEEGTWAEQTADGGYIVAGYATYYDFLGNVSCDSARLKKTDANGNGVIPGTQ